MNRRRTLILAALALVLSVAVTFVAYSVLSNRLQPVESGKIVVATHEIALGARLTAIDLRLTPWPNTTPIEGSFTTIADAVNRGVIIPMIANEPVLESKLAGKDGGAGLQGSIRNGMRAVAVKVNEVIGVAGFVIPGTRVDVILSGSPDRNTQTEMARIILENVEVLSSGKNMARDTEGKPLDAQVVTLLVSPEDSQKLALASMDGGNIQLALRNPLDIALMHPEPVSRGRLYGQPDTFKLTQAEASAPPRAPAPPPAPKRVIVAAVAPAPPIVNPPAAMPGIDVQLIQGTKSERITFAQKP
jgi:pilus assembly protein CpaB